MKTPHLLFSSLPEAKATLPISQTPKLPEAKATSRNAYLTMMVSARGRLVIVAGAVGSLSRVTP